MASDYRNAWVAVSKHSCDTSYITWEALAISARAPAIAWTVADSINCLEKLSPRQTNCMNDSKIAIPLKRFLLIEQCPAAWKTMDLYVFRDDTVAFYVGQSHFAFSRVWNHLIGGFHGHSIVGRFVWCNWPKSMKFTIELLSSHAEEFDIVGNNLDSAEIQLIQRWSPCFNVSQNRSPTPVPAPYLPANSKLRCSRSLNKLIHEAERVVKSEDAEIWAQSMN